MKRLRRWLIALLAMAALTLAVSAANAQADNMKITMTVDENGTARAEATLRVTFSAPLDTFTLTLGPNVSGVHVDGYNARVTRSGAQRVVTIHSEGSLPSTMDLRLTYTVRNTIERAGDTQAFAIRLLGGLRDADIQKLQLSVQMPGGFDAQPEFTSGYYADGIDNYLTIHVTDGGLLTAASTAPMLAGETLDLRLEMEPEYFTLHNVAGRTLRVDRIAMVVLALFALVYWWRALRSPTPRISLQSRAPLGIDPGVVGLLILGEPPDLALMVLHWAAYGYLRISRLRGGVLRLTYLIPMGNERTPYEQAIFAHLFSGSKQVTTGSKAWHAARKRANKAARTYWRNRLYQKKPGKLRVLRLCSVLFSGFATLYCADCVIPSMALRPALLAALTALGMLWALVLQRALHRLPMRRRKAPALRAAACTLVMLLVWQVTRSGAPLLAWLFALLTQAGTMFGPKRTQNGADNLSDLLAWRRYLRAMPRKAVDEHLEADPQYFYKTLLYAEALGIGARFVRAFEPRRLDPCDFLGKPEAPYPRSAAKFREQLLRLLADARGEQPPERKRSRRPAPPRRPSPPERRPVGAGRRRAEVYEPEDY